MGGRTWKGLGELLPLGSIHFWRGETDLRVCVRERTRERVSLHPVVGKVGVCVRARARSPATSISVSADEAHVRNPSEPASERAGGRATRGASMMRGCSGRTRLTQNQDRAGKKGGGRKAACRRKHERVCARLRCHRDLSPTFARTGERACLCVYLFVVVTGLYLRVFEGGRREADVVSLSEGAWTGGGGGKLEGRSSSWVCYRQLLF